MELEGLRVKSSELDALRAKEAEIAREIGAIEASLGMGKRRLPSLDQVKVASPCSASWDDMVGDARVRHCLACNKDVFHLSSMSRADAEAFLAERLGAETCVRFYQRADGTILTADCPTGVTRKRRKKIALAVAGAGAMALAATQALAMTCRQGGVRVVQGDIAMPTERQAPMVEPSGSHEVPSLRPPTPEGRAGQPE